MVIVKYSRIKLTAKFFENYLFLITHVFYLPKTWILLGVFTSISASEVGNALKISFH